MTPPPATTRKLSRALVLSLAALLLLGLIFGWSIYNQRQADKIIAAKLAAIRAQGFPTTGAELDAWYPEPLVQDNAALVFNTAFAQVIGLPPSTPWFDSQSSSNILSRTNPIPTVARAQLATLLSSNQAPLKLLHEGALLPSSRYPVNLSAGFNISLTHLTELRDAVRLLTYESLDHALENRTAASLESLIVSLRVGHSLSNEPSLISSLTQCSAYGQTVSAAENILNRSKFDLSTVKPLQEELLRAERSLHLHRAFAGERANGLDAFGNSVFIFAGANNSHGVTPRPSFGDTLTAAVYDALLKDSDLRAYLEVMDLYVSACTNEVSRLNPALKAAGAEFDKKLTQQKTWRMLLTGMLLPSLERAGERHVTTIARLRLTSLALSLQSGPLPESLSVDVPLDPFDAKPLRYRRTETGFQIWSIGPDCIDQGGLIKPRNATNDAYDLVFTVEKPSPPANP